MPNLSEKTKKLVREYQDWQENKESLSVISVDEVASRVSVFYEKLRGIVDWKEEHLIKRAAIERKLKRRLILAEEKKSISEPLILELIRGGHLANDQIETKKITEVDQVINKYLYILKNNPGSLEKEKIDLDDWLLGITACELEEIFSPSLKERALIEYMTESMSEKIKIVQNRAISIGGINEQEKNKQVYIACQRALFKLDTPIISYHLFKKRYQNWERVNEKELEEISKNIYLTREEIEKDLNHFLKDKFYKICSKYNTPYLLLGDILSEEKELDFDQPEKLEIAIKNAYNKRLSTLKSRLSRAGLYSTLSILITNSFALFIIEVPLAKIIMGSFSLTAILVDILGPTLLMFVLVNTIRLPSKNNLEIVLVETMKIIYQNEKKETYQINIPTRKNILIKSLIVFLYLIGALISLTIIIGILRWAGLPPTSYLVNIIFIALIAFAGLAIRNKGEELTVEEKKVGFFGFIFDVLFLPIVSLGRWLSGKWKKYNAISIFFNVLIDLPFQLFIEFIEQWRSFLKEKKEEIY